MTQTLEPTHASVPGRTVSVHEARNRQADGAILIDVRDAAEREADGAPAGALHMPLQHLARDIDVQAGDRVREIILLCARGERSRKAADMLAGLGYARVASVAGGFRRWCQEGLPVEGGLPDRDAAERYARQMRLPQVGTGGQARLASASVAIVGAGGLGSPVALYLAGAGVGQLTLIDDDCVARSNLHRQILHADARVGMPKVESGREALQALNPRIRVTTRHGRLREDNAGAWLPGHDVIVDAADNFPTRYLLAEASLRWKLPMVYGAVERFAGMASVFDPRRDDSPCYRCLFPEPPAAGTVPSCDQSGVLGVVPGLVGMVQATETLKLLLDMGDVLVGRVLHIDALSMRMREIRLRRHPGCPGCGSTAPP